MKEIVIITSLLTMLLVAWSVVDIMRLQIKEKKAVNFLWLVAIFLLPVIGSILYWQLGRPSIRNRKRVFRPDFKRR